jgi:hypothetical protein
VTAHNWAGLASVGLDGPVAGDPHDAVKEAGAGFRSIAEPMVDTTSQFAEVIIAVLGVAASYGRSGDNIEAVSSGSLNGQLRGRKAVGLLISSEAENADGDRR